MTYSILIDEPALKECVESNVYQSCHFDVGNNLAEALLGDKAITTIGPRIAPTWQKDILYLLQSRTPTGYLLVSSEVFREYSKPEDVLLIFQRICRFALKKWNRLSSSSTEIWKPGTDYGIVFPFPYSSHSGFRIILRKGYGHVRYEKRHGIKHLFAFAGGTGEVQSDAGHESIFKKAFEELTAVRTDLTPEIEAREGLPKDTGYHSLVLTDPNHERIRFQSYEQWLLRLTTDQERFVTSGVPGAQRVEGPAGTGKTLCLLLKAFSLCECAKQSNEECRVLFVSHSEATRDAIAMTFDALGPDGYHRKDPDTSQQFIRLCTLQEWCGELLGSKEISNAQYLDKDALASKEMRKLILHEIVETRRSTDSGAFEYLSEECKSFFLKEDIEYVADLLQHEIGVLIKGRASEKLETYLELPALSYCLPLTSANDRRFVFSLYIGYQKQLNESGVYDTDDIVLTSLGRLNTPIWRRRRATEGYDAIVIDETHLFNLNELSIFHHLLRDEETPSIMFSIDRSQAPGERGITARLVEEMLTSRSTTEQATRTSLIFRSSPQIIRLAEAITNTGATLFTTFENPLVDISSVISASDEKMAESPLYWNCQNDDSMCNFSVERATQISNRLKCPLSDVLVVASTQPLVEQLKNALVTAGTKYVQILHRGDLGAVRQGAKEGAIILSCPEFVGGLEFKAVLVVGVDDGRMPPDKGVKTVESQHFVHFRACNHLYVAITRARLAIELFYSNERGVSPLLQHALNCTAIEERMIKK